MQIWGLYIYKNPTKLLLFHILRFHVLLCLFLPRWISPTTRTSNYKSRCYPKLSLFLVLENVLQIYLDSYPNRNKTVKKKKKREREIFSFFFKKEGVFWKEKKYVGGRGWILKKILHKKKKKGRKSVDTNNFFFFFFF